MHCGVACGVGAGELPELRKEAGRVSGAVNRGGRLVGQSEDQEFACSGLRLFRPTSDRACNTAEKR
jgi:hypothetical protein